MKLDMQDAKALELKFLDLLNQQQGEQVYQDFLEQNTQLIPREFIQNHGIHGDLLIRKMSLSNDYTPDFFFMSKSSADWNLVLIEIEKPQSKYFKNNAGKFHNDFNNALDQILRWRNWFDNHANKSLLIDSTIEQIRVPAILRRNPCHIKYVLVHGRRSEFEGSDLKKGLIRAQERDDFKIMSYDSLIEALHTKSELYLCVRKNEKFEIISPKFISEAIFAWVDPSYLRITQALKDEIIKKRSSWISYRPGSGLVLDEVLPKLGICTT